MTSIVAKVKILPTDATIKSKKIVESIKVNLPEQIKIINVTEEPIAFGLEASIIDFKLEDKDGAIDDLEKIIRSSKNISQVDFLGISRMSATLK
ncbi:MAG TPA: elongation factor 1-beta [Nitrososphaerales archaeon]